MIGIADVFIKMIVSRKEDIMGLFSSKEDKELINRLYYQVEQQKQIIQKLENEKSLSNNMAKQNAKNNLNSDNKTFVLNCGKYVGAKDIPTGVYNLDIISGTGIIQTQKPYVIYERLESNPTIRAERNWTDTYNGLQINKETILDISESARIRFSFVREIGRDVELEKLIEQKENLVTELKELEERKNILKDEKIMQSVVVNGIGQANLIGCGVYKAGEDFPIGKYDLYAVRGEGHLSCTKGDVYISMSHTEHDNYIQLYRNLVTTNGCKIEVNGNINILMYHSRTIIPAYKDICAEDYYITAGNYKIGEDIAPGKYVLEVESGQGSIDDGDELYENLGEKYGTIKVRVNLKKGKNFAVSGSLKMHIFVPQPIMISEKELSIEECNTLCGGVYLAGEDIPYGYYDVTLVKGEGALEIEKLDDSQSDFYERFSQGKVTEYRNLAIEVGDKIVVESGLEVFLEYIRPYVDANISQNILRTLDDVKKELVILNNETIDKYYNFSEHSGLTSEECKNKLAILKQKEKELRNTEKDVVVAGTGQRKKLLVQSIRQVLRTFNMECDNIMFGIKLKSVDNCRKKIQQSFESLNKLYAVDNVQISKELLELKLEQLTLMYTYELKYEQEKDIQRAIKEQMIEEAKAQREIEEQKKKIEKDLQQHIGEVNRLMKYLQKTQIDAEKQLYMDKIKELEEKIKLLEGDKSTVLEREANAKAGFVYIISNIGSFGENIYKIGMTRRLEPMDRIHELSSASVPFEFDVHAMIFSSDAPELETMLHRHFADKAVNKVNPRKEFFNVSIDEIEKIVKMNYNETVQFTKIPIAAEYRQSVNM